MIQVIQILEGGVDLRSGEQIGPSLVLFNGKTSLSLPVAPQSLASIVELWAEAATQVSDQPRLKETAPTPMGAFQPMEEEEEYQPDDDEREIGEEYSDASTGVDAF